MRCWSLVDVRCLLFVDCCVLSVVWYFLVGDYCMLFVVCWLWLCIVYCCSLCVGCCVLFVVKSLFWDICYMCWLDIVGCVFSIVFFFARVCCLCLCFLMFVVCRCCSPLLGFCSLLVVETVFCLMSVARWLLLVVFWLLL